MSAASEVADCLEASCRRGPQQGEAASTQLWRQIVASTLGSATATLALNPINVMKVNLQKESPTGARSLRQVLSSVIAANGVAGLWAGAPIGLLQSLPNTVLYMSVYEALKEAFASQASPRFHNSSISAGLAGGLSRVACVSIMSPLEVLRTIQTGGAKAPPLEIMRRLHKTYGIAGFYRGWSSTIARDAPFSAIYWFCFDLLRPVWARALQSATTSPGSSSKEGFSNSATFLSGASASMAAALATHPFDVLKTQRQLSIDPSIMSKGAGPTPGAPVLQLPRPEGSVLALYRKSGVAGMYRGLSMRLATVIPASAIVITVYEYVKVNMKT